MVAYSAATDVFHFVYMYRMDGYSESDLLADLRVNMLFAFYLTRALLPTLRRAAPAQVLFIGFTTIQGNNSHDCLHQ